MSRAPLVTLLMMTAIVSACSQAPLETPATATAVQPASEVYRVPAPMPQPDYDAAISTRSVLSLL